MASRDKPLRILFVITGLEHGGAERMLLKLISRLAPSHELAVVSLAGYGALAPEVEAFGIPLTILGMKGISSLPAALWRLSRYIREWKPTVVSTWMYHADLVGGLAARIAGVRSVAWNIRHSDLPPAQTKRATRAVARANALLSGVVPRRILCCSESARRIHVALGYKAELFHIIPNGFDLQQFHPSAEARASVRQELQLEPDTPLIGLIARWDPQKNHRGFIQAAATLLDRYPTTHFVLAGPGCDASNPELVNLVSQARIAPNTHLLGPRSDMPRLTAALDIATSASIFGEAFPNVLGEAMACAVPCVTTDVGDSAWIVGDTGKVVAPGDVAGLVEAWTELLEMPPADRAKLGEQGRQRVNREFELGQIASRYESVFRAVIQESAPPGGVVKSCAD